MTVTMMSLMAKSWCVESIVNTAVMSLTSNVQLVGYFKHPEVHTACNHDATTTDAACKPPCVAKTPTRWRANLAVHYSTDTAARKPRHSPPRRYDANTAACKPRCVTATPTRRNASPAVSPQHRHSGMQAPACRHDTDAACKPRHVATTLTRRHASPAVSPQRRRQQGKRRDWRSLFLQFLAVPYTSALARTFSRFLRSPALLRAF
ncbi:hypothetical protein EDB89DRAFT_1905994 [Lactarius sanguifluus]|nr:hypothetical protein EDB89DRAFT_1905994 [Lactarius sanguifluus]